MLCAALRRANNLNKLVLRGGIRYHFVSCLQWVPQFRKCLRDRVGSTRKTEMPLQPRIPRLFIQVSTRCTATYHHVADADDRCENELQLCYRGNYYQDSFDRGIELWDSLCRSYVTFSPTSPSAKPYTAYPEDLCIDVDKACQTARNILSDCLPYVSDTDTSRLSSCECQPRLLRQAYTCQYIGNASCLAMEAATTNAYGYGICDNFDSVIGAENVSIDSTYTILPKYYH